MQVPNIQKEKPPASLLWTYAMARPIHPSHTIGYAPWVVPTHPYVLCAQPRRENRLLLYMEMYYFLFFTKKAYKGQILIVTRPGVIVCSQSKRQWVLPVLPCSFALQRQHQPSLQFPEQHMQDLQSRTGPRCSVYNGGTPSRAGTNR